MTDRARLLRAARRQHLAAFNEKVFQTLDPGTPTSTTGTSTICAGSSCGSPAARCGG